MDVDMSMKHKKYGISLMDMDMGADKEDGGFLDMMLCINADKMVFDTRHFFFLSQLFFYLL
jgi:hypothetical protein